MLSDLLLPSVLAMFLIIVRALTRTPKINSNDHCIAVFNPRF